MPQPSAPQIIELRQYTLHAGQRETLVALFEREFIETQAEVGLQVLGIFRNAEREDHFVWLRGFADMATRAEGLAAFYGGPVWQRHRDAANATIIDSDDVLLLRPLSPWPEPGEGGGEWLATVLMLRAPPDAALREALRTSGRRWLETEPATNNFPRLPVREGVQALVAFTRAAPELPPALLALLAEPPLTLRLLPTPRSPMR
jgi:NIPSNAP